VKEIAHLENRVQYVILPLSRVTLSIYATTKYVPITSEEDWEKFMESVTVEIEDEGRNIDNGMMVDLPVVEIDLLLLIHSAKKPIPAKTAKKKRKLDDGVVSAGSLRRRLTENRQSPSLQKM